MTEGGAMQRRETFGTLGVGHAVWPQPLSVTTRTGDEMNAVCEGLNSVRDEGTRPTAVNQRSGVRLGSARILACLRSGRQFLLPRTACFAPHACWMLPPIQSRRTRIGRAASAAPVSRDEADRKSRPCPAARRKGELFVLLGDPAHEASLLVTSSTNNFPKPGGL